MTRGDDARPSMTMQEQVYRDSGTRVYCITSSDYACPSKNLQEQV